MQMFAKKKRAISLVLLLFFVVVLSLSLVFISSHQNHKCIGMHCATCAQLQNMQSNTQQLSEACSVMAWLFSMLTFLLFVRYFFVHTRQRSATLIDLNVRHNK